MTGRLAQRIPGAALLALLGAAAACSADERAVPARPNVLFLCVDTLRADHLGSYGHRMDTSPAVDALAESGVRFADASVQWTKTWPSMASMLTGTYPTQTGIRYEPRRPLPGRNRTLAEMLREEGYATAAVVSNANLGERFAFDQGFDHFVESWMEEYRRRFGDREFENRPGLTKELTNARRVVDEGLAWLDGRDERDPFFLWLHFMEPHGPYRPPERHAERFRDRYPRKPVRSAVLPPYQRQRGADGRVIGNLGFYKAQYDAEIRQLDEQLERLLGALEERGLRSNTLVVFTSDHGESLDEHRYYLEHGLYPFQPTAHVPLVLAMEGRLPEGRVVEPPVGLVDLVPTVLDLLDLRVPESLPGRSLRRLAEGSADARSRSYVYVEAGVQQPSQRAVRRGPWKLVHFRAAEDRKRLRRPEWALYHLESDPRELRNVIDRHPKVAAKLREALRRYGRTATRAEDGGGVELEELDDRTQQQLRALGYIDSKEAPEGSSEPPPGSASAPAEDPER